MRKALLAGIALVLVLLSACSGKAPAALSHEDVQESVQQFYNEISSLDQTAKSSLEDFNEALASYSGGNMSADQLEKAIEKFQDTASDLSDKADDVKVTPGLPDNVEKLLTEAKDSFQKAYVIKKEASQSADSPDVTAEQFNQMNKNADIVMLYGISKLNEAREATGLLDTKKSE
ncbi:hypothetical protein [Paenibacillus rhizophilus]|uniref:Inhibitor of growth protein N-terminal histone-binding domain-containing protein n=1 Tax=Paenibacillus rhizophilus TaxID=1850366 RepID=A0A3N9P5U3_9BACL|nr:hypothetical protein [Paenibacillus rhizophilus]RQW11591.1 hypothetical protein EH198_11260 [Paenibacillus rhizophilus]